MLNGMRPLATLLSSALCVSLLSSAAFAQSPQQARGAAAAAPNDVRSQSVMDRADYLYRLGDEAFKKGDYDRARHSFDDSIDAILVANLDVRSDARLRAFYAELVDKIHKHQVLAQTDGDEGGFSSQAYVPAESEIADLSDTDLAALGDSANAFTDGSYDFDFTIGAPVYQFISYFTGGRGRGTMETGLRRSGR